MLESEFSRLQATLDHSKWFVSAFSLRPSVVEFAIDFRSRIGGSEFRATAERMTRLHAKLRVPSQGPSQNCGPHA
jgi:hypothetical protein